MREASGWFSLSSTRRSENRLKHIGMLLSMLLKSRYSSMVSQGFSPDLFCRTFSLANSKAAGLMKFEPDTSPSTSMLP